jgi:hypothetical protein
MTQITDTAISTAEHESADIDATPVQPSGDEVLCSPDLFRVILAP